MTSLMTSFDEVRQYWLIINHIKFGEHWMRTYEVISLAVLLGDQVTFVSIPCRIYKPIRHACAYWTSSNLGRETEEI